MVLVSKILIYCQISLLVWGLKIRSHSCCCLVTKSCSTLCNPMNCRLPGSSVHGISQVKTLEWVAIFFSRGSSQLRDQTQVCCVSCIVGRFLTAEPLGKAWITSVLTARLHCCGMKEATDKMSDKGDGWTARKLHFWKQATGHLRPQATLWQPSP